MATKKTQTQAKATKAEPKSESPKKTSARTETVSAGRKPGADLVNPGRKPGADLKSSEKPAAGKSDNGKSSLSKDNAPAEKKETKAATVSQEARKTLAGFEQIAVRAYLLWQERGCSHGSDVEDWLRAERELTTVK
jgi:hypothetical protein